jgi:hypothetical protein
MLFWGMPLFWNHITPIGITMRSLDHVVNVCVIVYLVVAFVGALSAHRESRPMDRIPMSMALIMLLLAHYIIDVVSNI